MKKKKKNCQRGYSCGYTCINIQKVCLKEFPEGVSVSLDSRQVVLSMPIDANKDVEVASPKKSSGAKSVKDLADQVKSFKDSVKSLKNKARDAETEADFERDEAFTYIHWQMGEAGAYKKAATNKGISIYTSKEEEKSEVLRELYNNFDNYFTGDVEKGRDVLKKFVDIDDRYKEAKKSYDSELEAVNKKIKDLYGATDESIRNQRLDQLAYEKWGKPSNQQKKVERLEKAGLSREEAVAVAAWISLDDYAPLNRAYYNPEIFKDVEDLLYVQRTNDLIKQAVTKLPKANRDDMIKTWKSKSFAANESNLYAKGWFRRGVSNIKDIDAFLKPYRDGVGSIIEEPGHFAATSKKGLGFITDAEVIYKVKAKDDGTGNGISLDQYKNYAWEGEIFWGQGQKFFVKHVKQLPSGKWEIAMEEVLDG